MEIEGRVGPEGGNDNVPRLQEQPHRVAEHAFVGADPGLEGNGRGERGDDGGEARRQLGGIFRIGGDLHAQTRAAPSEPNAASADCIS